VSAEKEVDDPIVRVKSFLDAKPDLRILEHFAAIELESDDTKRDELISAFRRFRDIEYPKRQIWPALYALDIAIKREELYTSNLIPPTMMFETFIDSKESAYAFWSVIVDARLEDIELIDWLETQIIEDPRDNLFDMEKHGSSLRERKHPNANRIDYLRVCRVLAGPQTADNENRWRERLIQGHTEFEGFKFDLQGGTGDGGLGVLDVLKKPTGENFLRASEGLTKNVAAVQSLILLLVARQDATSEVVQKIYDDIMKMNYRRGWGHDPDYYFSLIQRRFKPYSPPTRTTTTAPGS